jgi:hypothetical protein
VGGGLREIRSEGVNRASCERLVECFLCIGMDVQVSCLGSAGLRRLHRLCRLSERSASCVRSVCEMP